MSETTILIVPGLRDHVPQHWQTLLAARLDKVRSVPPLEDNKLSLAARVDAIERELRANGWDPRPKGRLGFPSIVVGSTNDHLASLPAVARMARQWGSELVNLGAVGHLNPASGYGLWPQAEAFIRTLDR